MDISDDEDALEAQRDFVTAKGNRGELFRKPPSPKKFESSQPFGSSPTPLGNPFLLEDDISDEDEVLQGSDPEQMEHPEPLYTYVGTVHAKTSYGQPLRISKRKRRTGETVFRSEVNQSHASKTKHYGIEIHALIGEAEALSEASITKKTDSSLTDEQAAGPAQSGMWVDKYRPKKFTELLGDERTSRDVMRWIKNWDYCVFGRAAKEKPKKKENGDNPSKDSINMYTDPHNRPERKILMLTGPPGFGKTTLAHIAARQAGYNVIEINASDDRTGAVVQNKIGDALESQAVFNPRPTLVVIDEVDGVSSAGGEAGFIRSLLKFITDDEKATQQHKASVSTDVGSKRNGKKRTNRALLRPIICICNDQYVAALRPLRPYCLTISFRPLSIPMVVARLRTICHNEGMQADARALNALCEIAESDLRSCVNSLQYIRMKSKKFTLESVASTLAHRDMSRSSHSVVESVFKLLDAKKERKKGKSSSPESNIARIADLAMTNNEFSKILNACFAHYPKAPYHDNLFSKPTDASDWLFFYDQCERGVYERQHGELMNYMPYAVSAFHHLFATHESKSSLERSKADWEAREKLRINSEIMQGWISGVRASLRQLFNPTTFTTELLSYSLRIIGVNLNPSNSHLVKTSDKLALARVVDAMLSLGLQYTQYRVDDGSYIFRLEPPISQALDFDGAMLLKGETLLPSRYATRQVISSELGSEKIRRSLEAQGVQPVAVDKAAAMQVTLKDQMQKRRATGELPFQPPVKKDFFGRTIELTAGDTASTMASHVPEKPKSGVHIKFSDGFSDAVRNNITIRELLRR